MYLLDTNVISELRKAGSNRADANVIQWAKEKPTTSLFISAITVLEIEMGGSDLKNMAKLPCIKSILR
jgi:predicted nucleic acid-binding protein